MNITVWNKFLNDLILNQEKFLKKSNIDISSSTSCNIAKNVSSSNYFFQKNCRCSDSILKLHLCRENINYWPYYFKNCSYPKISRKISSFIRWHSFYSILIRIFDHWSFDYLKWNWKWLFYIAIPPSAPPIKISVLYGDPT